MKHLLAYFILIVGLAANTYAQEISGSEKPMSEGIHYSFHMISPSDDDKLSLAVWKEYLGNYGRVKKNKQGEYYKEGASLPSFSSSRVDVYSTIEKVGKKPMIRVWVKSGNQFINRNSPDLDQVAVKNFLKGYAIAVQRQEINNQIDSENKVLGKLESQQDKLLKDNQKYHDKIEGAEKLIEDMKAAIETNLSDQESKQAEIDAQKEVVQSITNSLNDL